MWTFEILFWPYFLGKIVDLLSRSDLDRASAWPNLRVLLMWGAAAWVFMEAGFRLRDYLQALAHPKLEAEIRMDMFDHVQHHSPKYFNEHFAGSLSNKIGDMVFSINIMVRYVWHYLIPACFTCVVALFIFAQMNPFLAMIVGIWIVVHFALCWFFTLKCANYAYLHGESRSTLIGKIVDSLTNNFAVNLFFRFRFEKDNIALFQKQERETNRTAQIYTVKMFTSLCAVLALEVFALTGFILFDP